MKKHISRMPIGRTTSLVVKELNNELLVYDLEKQKAFCLNETARLLFEKCDGISSTDSVVSLISNKHNVGFSHDLLTIGLNELDRLDLLVADDKSIERISTVSRRKIIRSSMIAGMSVPVILSIVAPRASYAQSGLECAPFDESCDLPTPSPNPAGNCCPGLICGAIPGIAGEGICRNAPPPPCVPSNACACADDTCDLPFPSPNPAGNCCPGLTCVASPGIGGEGICQPTP